MSSPEPIVSTVHHVSFRVDDVQAALDFYVGILGCTQLDRPAIPVPGAWLQAGQTQVHLIGCEASEETGFPPSQINPVANHVAFCAPDFEAAEERLKAKGVDYAHGPSPLVKQIFMRDPSGNMIELAPM